MTTIQNVFQFEDVNFRKFVSSTATKSIYKEELITISPRDSDDSTTIILYIYLERNILIHLLLNCYSGV